MKAILLMAALAATTLAGCTDGPSGPTFVTPPIEDGKYVIEMGGSLGNRFSPQNAEVPVGAIVLFRNLGGAHNVVSGNDGEDAGVWTAGEVGSGDFELQTDASMVGDQDYYCQPHISLGMVGVLRVTSGTGTTEPSPTDSETTTPSATATITPTM